MAGKSGADKLKGKAKEMTGKVMGDREKQVDGKIDQVRAKARKAGEKVRERVEETARSSRRDRG